MKFDISKLITDNTNIIEIYMCNPKKNKDDLKIDIFINNDILEIIRKRFKLTKETTIVSYNRNNLSYIYDLSNDSQYLYLRKVENILNINNFYGFSFNEMKMQSYTFGCTNDIDSRYEYKLEEYKINNRLSLMIKNNNVYIYYKHSKEVDLDKIQDIINNIIKKMIII
jgi:hypothetical protein